MNAAAQAEAALAAAPAARPAPPEVPEACEDCGGSDMRISVITADGARYCSRCWRDGVARGRP